MLAIMLDGSYWISNVTRLPEHCAQLQYYQFASQSLAVMASHWVYTNMPSSSCNKPIQMSPPCAISVLLSNPLKPPINLHLLTWVHYLEPSVEVYILPCSDSIEFFICFFSSVKMTMGFGCLSSRGIVWFCGFWRNPHKASERDEMIDGISLRI